MSDSCQSEDLHDYDEALSVGSVFIILVASLLGTLLPIVLKRHPRFQSVDNHSNPNDRSLNGWPFVILVGKHVGTGVLLSLGFIHLLVPAFEELGSECLPDSWQEYSYAPLFAMLAAIVMHLIETMVLEYTVFNQPRHDDDTSKSGQGGVLAIQMVGASQQNYQSGGAVKSPTSHTSFVDPVKNDATVDTIDPSCNDYYHGHAHSILLSSKAERTVGAYLLEFALTSHSIIVGITLGVALGHDLVSLIPALTFHQFFEGFALGARLAELEFGGWNEALLATIYSLSAPLGIAVGIGIAHSYDPGSVTALLVQGIFDSISAGIILYVAFVHMLASEFAQDYKRCGSRRTKKSILFAGLYVGAAVMAIIGIWL